jgi:CoA binding domain
VRPHRREVLGIPCVDSLAEIEEPIDLVDVFRRAEFCPEVAEQAAAAGAKALWLPIVRAHETPSGFEAKAVRNGPRIEYQGQPDPNEPYKVESFSVHVHVNKGDRLAIKTKKTSTLRCSSGGPNTLLFAPPLVVGEGFQDEFDDDGCWMLIEAVAQPN